VSPRAPPADLAHIQRVSLTVVTLAAFLVAAWVASALWEGLLLGLLTAFAIEPATRAVLRRFPRRRALVAAVSVLAIGALVGAVLAGLLLVLEREVLLAAHALAGTLHDVSPDSLLGARARKTLAGVGITPAMISERLGGLADRAATEVSHFARAALGSTFSLLGGGLIAFVTAFYVLKAESPIDRRLETVLPLDPRTTRELVAELRSVGRGTLIGSVVAAFVQGALATVGYVLGRAPQPLLLGALTAVASFVPVLGTPLVWVPLGVGLILAGRAGSGIFELIWGGVFTVTLVDYVLRPIIAGPSNRSHPLLFIVGVIGGVAALGPIGVIAGPIAMTFFTSVIRIYRREVVAPARAAGAAAPPEATSETEER
jgi:predicted PurR-regulated permease PerM